MSAERLKRIVHWLPSLSDDEIEQLFDAVREWRRLIDEEKTERNKRRDDQ
jgi:hypothetical protein